MTKTEEYIVPNCPKCDSEDVTELIFGLVRKIDGGDIVYGEVLDDEGHKFDYRGCLMRPEDEYIEVDDGLEDDEENDSRGYICNACHNRFFWRDWRAKQA